MVQALALRRTTLGVALAITGMLTLCLGVLASPARAQLSSETETLEQDASTDTVTGGVTDSVTDTVKDTTDAVTAPVKDTVGGVGDKITETGGTVGDTIKDTGSKVGDTVGGDAGDTIKKTTDTAGSTVKDTSSELGSTVTTTTDQVSETTAPAKKLLEDAMREVGGGDNEAAGNGRDGKQGSKTNGTFLHRSPDRLAPPAPSRTMLDLAAVRSIDGAYATLASSTDDGVTFADVARRALETAKRFAFPLALTLIVIAYLGIHGWFDRRDPKLALAAVDPDAELLSFDQ